MAAATFGSRIFSLFDKLFGIKPKEFYRVQAFFFFLTASSMFGTMGATVGDTLFLARFGSERAEHLLPWVCIGIGVLTVVLTFLYEHFEERFPREKMLIGVYLFLAVSLVLFRLALRTGILWLYFGLVTWLEASALTAFMVFFSFAGDYFTGRDAKRLYGYINGGIALGSVIGGFSVDPLVKVMGDENLLYVCAALLACGALFCVVIAAIAKPVGEGEGEESEEEEEGEAKLPISAVLSNRYLQMVIIVVVACQAYGWLVDYQLKVVASRALDEEALAAFFGKFYSYLGLVQFFVQFVLVGWLLRRFGTVKCLMILPLLLLAGSATFFVKPLFLVAAAGNFLRLTFLETLDEPATELLFMPLQSRLRLRAQSFVEGIVLPAGIMLSGVLLLALAGMDIQKISLVGMALGAVWVTAAVFMVPRYRDMLAASLRQMGLEGMDLSSALSGVEGQNAMRELLRGSLEQQTLALDLWQGRALADLTEPVTSLLRSPSQMVAVKALEALAADKSSDHLPQIKEALGDSRAGVRAAAISAFFDLDPHAAITGLAKWLADPEPDVRVAVLTGCLAHGGRLGSGIALPQLNELVKSAKVSDRVIAAKVLASAAAVRDLLKTLQKDGALEVRREIVAGMIAAPEPNMVPWLVEQLREPSLRPAASEALEGMPIGAVAQFIEILADRERPLEERSLLLRIMGGFGGARAARVLWDLAGSNEDVRLRVAAAETLLYMKAENKSHDISKYQDDAFLYDRLEELALINKARDEAHAVDPFFCSVIFDHARLEVKAALYLMALHEEGAQIHQVEETLFEGTEAQKSNALEIIEVIFPHEKAAHIVGLIGPLVGEPEGAGTGLAPETIAGLMKSQSWLRVATRYHCETHGVAVDGGKMTGHEGHMYKLMSHLSFLKEVKLFEGVSGSYLMSLAKIIQERSFCKGEILFSEGGKGEACYLVQEGFLRVLAGGKEVARVGRSESIGEMAVIEERPYSATAVAEGDVRVLKIPAEAFTKVLATHPEITMALLRRVAGQLREARAASAAAGSAKAEG